MTQPYSDEPYEGLRITDKRKVDPVTYEVREPATPAPAPAGPAAAAPMDSWEPSAGAAVTEQAGEPTLDPLDARIAELTDDLQRVHAEYANYRKRVDRDRELIKEIAVAGVLLELLPILDDIGRARGHGELEGGLKSVGEALEATVARLGLEAYGEQGEDFDPAIHEALTHEAREDVTGPTVAAVFQPGYRYAGRVVRPTRVAVADAP